MARRLWVSLAGHGSLSVIGLPEGREIARIDGLSSPGSIAVRGDRAYVVDRAEGTLLCVDGACRRVFCVPAAPDPTSVCLSSDGNRVFVGGGESESVAMFDARDGAPLAATRVHSEPRSLDAEGELLLVACARPSRLVWLNAHTLEQVDEATTPWTLCGAVFCQSGVAAALVRDEMRGGRLCVLGKQDAFCGLSSAPLILRGDSRMPGRLYLGMSDALAVVELAPWSFQSIPYEGWPDDILADEEGLIVADASADTVWRIVRGQRSILIAGGKPTALASG